MDVGATGEICSRLLYRGFSFQSASVSSVGLIINDYWLATNGPISLSDGQIEAAEACRKKGEA